MTWHGEVGKGNFMVYIQQPLDLKANDCETFLHAFVCP